MIKADELTALLAHCYCSENYWAHWTKRLVYTDGVKCLADNAEAYWLVDIVASYQGQHPAKNEPFQCWVLSRRTGTAFVIEMNDGRTKNAMIRQEIEFSDFPLDTITLYLCDGVLMLTSEY